MLKKEPMRKKRRSNHPRELTKYFSPIGEKTRLLHLPSMASSFVINELETRNPSPLDNLSDYFVKVQGIVYHD
jgi:hypothetical protein